MPVVLSEGENSLNISFLPAVGLSSLCFVHLVGVCLVESKLRDLLGELEPIAHMSHMNPLSIAGQEGQLQIKDKTLEGELGQ